MAASAPLVVRPLRRCVHALAEPRMQAFTRQRDAATADEIWLVEHPPIYTLGRAARTVHVHAPGSIPVTRCERGGQVTYHGPGQVVAYLLVDLRRRALGVRRFVERIEAATISLLQENGIDATRRAGAPGVYLRESGAPGAKIASIGVRITNGCSYHGVALNVDMDLEPFSRIDPCGYPGLSVTDMRSCIGPVQFERVAARFGEALAESLRG